MDEQPRPATKSILLQPPSRREVLLFGLLILAIVWAMMNHYPVRVISVPDVSANATLLAATPERAARV